MRGGGLEAAWWWFSWALRSRGFCSMLAAGGRSGQAPALSGPAEFLYTCRRMSLLRSFATVGGYTMASRVLGFVRDILTAAFLGAGPVADAFFIAQRLPNLFRSLFAEGAFNAAFVPLFAG